LQELEDELAVAGEPFVFSQTLSKNGLLELKKALSESSILWPTPFRKAFIS